MRNMLTKYFFVSETNENEYTEGLRIKREGVPENRGE